MSRLALVAALALSIPMPAVAQDEGGGTSAEDDQRARELYRLGDSLYEEGRYDAAITTFQEAYRLSPRPLLLFNMANAQERAGYLQDAVDSLRRYLAVAPEEERETLEARISSLEARIAHEYEEPPEPAPEPPPVEVQPPTPAGPPAEEPAPALPVAGIALLAAGGGALVGMTVFGAVSLAARNDARSACQRAGDRTLCPDSADGALDRNRRFAILADVSLGAFVVASGLGLYFLIHGLGRRRPETVQPTVALDQRGGELGLSAHF